MREAPAFAGVFSFEQLVSGFLKTAQSDSRCPGRLPSLLKFPPNLFQCDGQESIDLFEFATSVTGRNVTPQFLDCTPNMLQRSLPVPLSGDREFPGVGGKPVRCGNVPACWNK